MCALVELMERLLLVVNVIGNCFACIKIGREQFGIIAACLEELSWPAGNVLALKPLFTLSTVVSRELHAGTHLV